MSINGAYADIGLTLRVVVSESSTEVMRNLYPDRWLVVSADCDNVELEWDDAYLAARAECLRSELKAKTELLIPWEQRRPGDDVHPNWETETLLELVRSSVRRDPRIGFAVASEVAEHTGVTTEFVLDRALGELPR
jgi:hypothetical protein